MAQAALVYFHKRLAGILRKKMNGYEFRYDPGYLEVKEARAISISLPLRAEPYQSQKLFPFFEGMLPEGWLLNLMSAKAKIDKNNKFALLLDLGQDMIGAVSIKPIDEESDA